MLDRDTTTRIEKAKEEARKPLSEKYPWTMFVLKGLAGVVGVFGLWLLLTRML